MGKKGQSKYTGKFKAGHSFGSWTVVDGKIHGSPAEMDVRCQCGTVKRTDVYTLVKGTSTSCGCVRVGENAPNWQGINGVSKTLLSRGGGGFTGSYAPAYATVYTAQAGHCSLTSQPLTPTTAKLVAISNTQPISPTNATWVHTSVAGLANSAGGAIGAYNTATTIATTPHPNIFEQMGMKPIRKKEKS